VDQEGRILVAISALKMKQIPSTRRAAEIFNVPKSILDDRLNGCQYRTEKRANSHRLSPTQEESLIEWILSMNLRGVSPRSSHVQEMANIVLQADDPPWIQTYRQGLGVSLYQTAWRDETRYIVLRIQKLSWCGLTAYKRSKCNMASPLKISTTFIRLALLWA
jgi:hypothetical protein